MLTQAELGAAKERAAGALVEAGVVLTPAERKAIEVVDFGLSQLDEMGLEIVVYVVHLGPVGRVGKRVEDELARNEVLATRRVSQYLNTLVDSFKGLRDIVNGEITPIELRAESMLGYGTTLRVLAGVYHELKRADEGKKPFSESEIRNPDLLSFHAPRIQ